MTHDLTFGDRQATLAGVSYFKLLLDVNEPDVGKSLISLDQLQFYTSTTSNVGALGTLRYTFSSGDGVILDASRKHGRGSGDMYAYIPMSDFAGTRTSDFVYLYAHFGNTDSSQAGFEEWALVNVAPIPEMNALFPSSVFLRFPLPCNIYGDITRGDWATYSFHKLTLQCLAEATAIVASVFLPKSDGVVLQTIPRHA